MDQETYDYLIPIAIVIIICILSYLYSIRRINKNTIAFCIPSTTRNRENVNTVRNTTTHACTSKETPLMSTFSLSQLICS